MGISFTRKTRTVADLNWGPRAKISSFSCSFGENWSNSRLAPCLGNPRSATDRKTDTNGSNWVRVGISVIFRKLLIFIYALVKLDGIFK